MQKQPKICPRYHLFNARFVQRIEETYITIFSERLYMCFASASNLALISNIKLIKFIKYAHQSWNQFHPFHFHSGVCGARGEGEREREREAREEKGLVTHKIE